MDVRKKLRPPKAAEKLRPLFFGAKSRFQWGLFFLTSQEVKFLTFQNFTDVKFDTFSLLTDVSFGENVISTDVRFRAFFFKAKTGGQTKKKTHA